MSSRLSSLAPRPARTDVMSDASARSSGTGRITPSVSTPNNGICCSGSKTAPGSGAGSGRRSPAVLACCGVGFALLPGQDRTGHGRAPRARPPAAAPAALRPAVRCAAPVRFPRAVPGRGDREAGDGLGPGAVGPVPAIDGLSGTRSSAAVRNPRRAVLQAQPAGGHEGVFQGIRAAAALKRHHPQLEHA